MITFSKLGSYGRLGNQLFQYAILKSVSLKTGFKIVLPKDIFNNEWHGQKCLLNNFKLKSVNYGEVKTNKKFMESSSDTILSPKEYDESLYDIEDNTDFFGYFQSPKYYENIKNEIREEIQLNDEYDNFATNFLLDYNNTTVSLHVRRGDVSDGTNKNSEWANDFNENSILYQYYHKALTLIPKDSTVFLFTGGSRKNDLVNDIEWCRKNFKDKRIIFIEGLNEIQTFSIMTKTDINIIGFKSTFSWWSSFLNKKEHVYAPNNFNPTRMDIKPEVVYPTYFKII